MRDILIFDYGGVIESHHTKSFCEWIKKKFSIQGEVWSIFKKYENLRDLGKIDKHELYSLLTKELDINLSEKEFYSEYFKNHVKTHFEVLEFIEKELFGRYELYLFSNNSQINVDMLRNKVDFEKLFNKCIYSFNLGVRKPDLEFFKKGLSLIGHKGEECIFFDDQVKSKENAEKNGIKFIQYTSIDGLKKSLRNLKLIS